MHKKNSILIVDDESLNITALTHILRHDYTVFVAKNGYDAMMAAEKHSPDVILLDILMPDTDGYTVISDLKKSEKTQNIPVIFITGLNDPDAEVRGLALGAADYITKPFSPALVKLRVQNQVKLLEQFRMNDYDIKADAHWYKSILDAIPLPISVTDENMKWTFVNKATENFLNLKRENMYGEHCSMWKTEICGTNSCGIASAKRGLKQVFFNRNDSSYQVDVESLLSMEGKTAGYIEIVQDITNVQQLTKQQTESEMTSRAKSVFLANMSHEIRTPMNAISGITELLVQNDNLPENVMEGLGRIHNSCNMLLGIINDILDFSKIEAGKLSIMPAEYNTANLINDAIHLNIMWGGDKPISFEVDVNENLPSKLIGDELRIKQLLNNLLSNAFKYTDTGKVTLSVSFEEAVDDAEKIMLVFKVQDTGFGMTEEQIKVLFDEYSRFSEGHGQTIEGTGLGLSIVQRLAGLMNGDVSVESKLHEGSLFTLRLPQSKACETVIGREVKENLEQFRVRYLANVERPKLKNEIMPYGSVLIVDDVETNLYVARGLMRSYKLQIDIAASGFEAVKKIKNGNVYDIIFMDHMMPRMDGIEATKKIRDMGYAHPIVALTANALVGHEEMFLSSGFDGFISKPIDIRHLNSVLNKLIRDKQPPDVIEAARQQMYEKEAEQSADSFAMKQIAELASVLEKVLATNVSIEGLDIAKWFKRYGSDEKTYFKVLRSFTSDIRSVIDTVENVCEDSIEEYKITVHGIRGASAGIFADGIRKMSASLEKAAEAEDYEYIEEHNLPFVDATMKMVCDIERMLSVMEAQNPKPRKDKPDAELLAELKAACEIYFMDGADKAMSEIDAYQYDTDNELVEWLRDKVGALSFGEIAERLSDI